MILFSKNRNYFNLKTISKLNLKINVLSSNDNNNNAFKTLYAALEHRMYLIIIKIQSYVAGINERRSIFLPKLVSRINRIADGFSLAVMIFACLSLAVIPPLCNSFFFFFFYERWKKKETEEGGVVTRSVLE